MLKKILVFAIALVLTIFLPSCGSTHSSVRFVAISPDSPNVDALVDGHTEATNLAFLQNSPYATIASGNRTIEVRQTGATTDLVDAPNVNFFQHNAYTIFYSGLTTANPPNQTINLVNDDNKAPASGNIKLRFFHGAPSGPACPPPETASCMDIYVVAPGTDITNLSPTIPHLVYQQVTNYLAPVAASYEIIWTQNATKTVEIDQTFSLTAGQIRTFVATDVPGGGSLSGTLLELADLN